MANDKTVEYKDTAKRLPSADKRVNCLIVLSGPDQGAVHPLQEGDTIAGRSPDDCQIHLSEPGISRTHAKFTLKDGQLSIQDLDSTNGISLNGEVVTAGVLSSGDTLSLGGKTSVRITKQDQKVTQLMMELYQDAKLDSSGVLSVKSLMPRLKASRFCSLAVVEIDQLETARNRFGPVAASELITHVASTLKNDLASKGLVASLGGEGFLINLFCQVIDADDALASSMKAIEHNHFRVDTSTGAQFMQVTVSAGAAALIELDDFDEALAAAETALQVAKQMGRNRIKISERRWMDK